MKNLKPTRANLYKLQRCMFEFTGLVYYFHMFDIGFSDINFFNAFYSLKKEVENKIQSGEVFKYNLVRLDGSKVPFIYNYL